MGQRGLAGDPILGISRRPLERTRGPRGPQECRWLHRSVSPGIHPHGLASGPGDSGQGLPNLQVVPFLGDGQAGLNSEAERPGSSCSRNQIANQQLEQTLIKSPPTSALHLLPGKCSQPSAHTNGADLIFPIKLLHGRALEFLRLTKSFGCWL